MTYASVVEPTAFPLGVAVDVKKVIVSAAAFVVESLLRVFECFTFFVTISFIDEHRCDLQFFASCRPLLMALLHAAYRMSR
jgi:hypothetical protein